MLPLLILASAALVLADYQKFFFSANGTCPGLAWPCVQNSVAAACAYDSIIDKHYCCGGAAQGTCRISSPDCLGADGGHSSTQQRCTAGDSNWCCLKDTESCTSRIRQINVCIATQPDTISGVSQYLLNETFSSLSSATPAGITYAFDATSLSAVALATSLSTSSSTIVSDQPPPSSLSSSPTPIPTKSSSSSDTVSGGTIAGAVVGCVVGIAAILIIGYIVLRRCPRGKLQKEEVGHVSKQLWEERKTHSGIHNMSELPNSSAPAEMGGVYEAHELPGRKLASELPT